MRRDIPASAVVAHFALIVSASVVASLPLRAQVGPTIPQCYRLAIGAWQPGLGVNEAYYRLPSAIRLDTLAGERIGRRLEPPMTYPHHGEMRGTPYWTSAGDTVRLVWSDGLMVTAVKLVRRGDDLVGDAVAESDAHPIPAPPLPRAAITAHPMSCAEAGLRPAR